MVKKFLLTALVITGGIAGYFYFTHLPDPSIKLLGIVKARIGSGTFTLYAPTDDKGLQKGLSVFRSLPEDRGMIFRGMPVGTQIFWMKDMKFDIDILWMNKDNQIIHIVYAASKDSYPMKFSNPQGTASSYVVELNAGMCDKFGIAPGTVVEIR